jgi:chromosome segregation ATPase
MIMYTLRTLVALLLLPTAPLALHAQSETGKPPEPPPNPPAAGSSTEEAARELAVKREELTKVTQEIGQIQSQAETIDAVKVSREKYRETLQAEMVRAAPDLESEIERQAQLVTELNAAPAAAEGPSTLSPDQQRQKLAEYRALHQKLAPVEQGVREVPVVQETRKEYFDRLIAEMQRIEPRTDELLARHRELVAVVRELTAQAQTG